ncbi:MAG: archaellin/type IV pilin N-terminal domain-containing protein [Caldivirga sp.]
MGNTGVLGGRVRRGIEPIVAAILLIVITVVAAVLLYIWFNGYLSSTTSKVSQVSVPEELQIVNVALYPSASPYSYLIAYIQNVGPIPATINQAYVLNATTLNVVCVPSLSYYYIPPSSPSSTGPSVPASGLTVPSGTAAELILSLSSCSLAPNTYYVLKLVTARGTQVTYQFST